MFRSASADAPIDPRLKQILETISQDVFGADEALEELDFDSIEQRAHEIGRKVARQLCQDAAAKQARTAEQAHVCPDCQRSCPGAIESRPLLTCDGPIELQEAGHSCSHC